MYNYIGKLKENRTLKHSDNQFHTFESVQHKFFQREPFSTSPDILGYILGLAELY